jgi:hypothetical protein
MISSTNATITAITIGNVHQRVEKLHAHVQQQHGAR